MTENTIKPWMRRMAVIHAMNEASTKGLNAKTILEAWGGMHANPNANFAGMGDPTLPGASLQPDGSFVDINGTGVTHGSGDMPVSTLPMAMAIAAKTIALELVPTVPISVALTILPYVNGVYAGGATNRNLGKFDRSEKNMRLVKAHIDFEAIAKIINKGQDATAEQVAALKPALISILKDKKTINMEGWDITFTGLMSFYDKSPIFEIAYMGEALAQVDTNDNPTYFNLFTATAEQLNKLTLGKYKFNDQGEVEKDDAQGYEVLLKVKKFDTVKAYEDFVPFFTGASKYPATGEQGNVYANKYGFDTLNPYLRSEGEVTPSNIMGLEFSSTKVDAKTIKVKGSITREQFQDMTAYGYDPYGLINAVLTNECTQRINFDILKALHQQGKKHAELINFNAKIVVDSNLLHENSLTIQRQVVAKFNLASNIISTRSRVSPADWVVVSAGIATAIQDMPTFMAAPATTFTATSGNNSIYTIGTLGRLKVYVDPYLPFDSKTCLVGAIGTEQSPGIKFMPYILAEQVTYPSEGMDGQNAVSMSSRYAIAPAGMNPESMYLSFDLKLEGDNDKALEAVFPYLG